MKKLRVKKPILIPLVLIMISSAVFIFFILKDTDSEYAELYEAKEADFTVTITEPGELIAMESITVSAEIDNPIIFLATEGNEVKKGDLLVRFDAAKYQVALDDSKAGLAVAEADLLKTEKDLEAQKQKLLGDIGRSEAEISLTRLALTELKKKPLPDEIEKARLNFEKAKIAFDIAKNRFDLLPELVKKGFITKNTLEEAQLEYLEAKANVQIARFNLNNVLAGASSFEMAQAEIRHEQASSALENARRGMAAQLQAYEAAVIREKANVERAGKLINKAEVKLRRVEIHAPRDGLVIYVQPPGGGSSGRIEPGMIPFEGQPLIYLPDLSQMGVNTQINEFDIGRITIGGEVEIRLEAFPDAFFHGEVTKIGSLARFKQGVSSTSMGVKVFDVKVWIKETDPILRPGLTATLDFIVYRAKKKISIPLTAVVLDGNDDIVYVMNLGRKEERKVLLGPSNIQNVVVEEGLLPGEKVFLNIHSRGKP